MSCDHKSTRSVMGNVNAFQHHLASRCKFLKDLIDVVGVCNASQTETCLCAVVTTVGIIMMVVVVQEWWKRSCGNVHEQHDYPR